MFKGLLRSELQQPVSVEMLSICGISSLFKRHCLLFSIIAFNACRSYLKLLYAIEHAVASHI
jgi:hypothetical protein